MGQEDTFTPHEETLTPEKGNSGSEKATQGRRKPGGTKDDYVGTIPHMPALDEFLNKSRRGRPPGVKFKNTARVRVDKPRLGSKLRGDVNIVDDFSSQTGGQGAPPERDKMHNLTTHEPTSDMILLSKRSHDTEFPIFTKTGSEADHNFFPLRGSEKSEKWADIVKRKIK